MKKYKSLGTLFLMLVYVCGYLYVPKDEALMFSSHIDTIVLFLVLLELQSLNKDK